MKAINQTALWGQTVLNGPFKGMQYPFAMAAGSSYLPKILGSYERELQPDILSFLRKSYTSIVNIGCGEGYYAVGLAMRCPKTDVYAFDSDPEALVLCGAMAELNRAQVRLAGICDRNTLLQLNLGGKAFILCDCEGYENQLFDKDTIAKLARHDFLIELHDFVDLNTTKNVYSIFTATHNCRLVESVDDMIKAYTYDYAELGGLDLEARRQVVAEGRPGIMRWLIAQSKEPDSPRTSNSRL